MRKIRLCHGLEVELRNLNLPLTQKSFVDFIELRADLKEVINKFHLRFVPSIRRQSYS